MNLKEWLSDLKLKFKKDRKLIEEPKIEKHLFKKWIDEEDSLRYSIGSYRNKKGFATLKEINDLDEKTILSENWGLDRIALYYCDEWNKKHPLTYTMSFVSNHHWEHDFKNNYIKIKDTDIMMNIYPSKKDRSWYNKSEIEHNLYIEIKSDSLNVLIKELVDETYTNYIFKALEKLINCFRIRPIKGYLNE